MWFLSYKNDNKDTEYEGPPKVFFLEIVTNHAVNDLIFF